MAKSVSLLKSIKLLYDNEDFYNGWILYRSLTDRLVYLYYLNDNNLYDSFSDWSYVKTYEQKNSARADEQFKKILKDPFFNINTEDARKYSYLRRKTSWQKPDPYKILKSKGIEFLYKYGYDYASMHTHPMADDGNYEFYQMTGLEPNPYTKINQQTLVSNSVLLCTMILQEVFNFFKCKL
jgi:hypothetical protein